MKKNKFTPEIKEFRGAGCSSVGSIFFFRFSTSDAVFSIIGAKLLVKKDQNTLVFVDFSSIFF